MTWFEDGKLEFESPWTTAAHFILRTKKSGKRCFQSQPTQITIPEDSEHKIVTYIQLRLSCNKANTKIVSKLVTR